MSRVVLRLGLLPLVACGTAATDSAAPFDTATPGDTAADTADSGPDTAETGGETGDTGADTADTAPVDSGDSGDDPPPAPPVSSRCIVASDTTGQCTNGVYAESWDGSLRYEWVVTDGYKNSTLTEISGGARRDVVAIHTQTSWMMTGGLAVLPGGDLVLGGITLTNEVVTVGSDSVSLGPDYARFVVRVGADGTLRFVKSIPGITGEPIVTAPRWDDTALVSGTFYQDTSFGADTVKTTFFFDNVFVAAVDDAGTWLWGTAPENVGATNARLYFEDAVATADGGMTVTGKSTFTLHATAGDFTCATGSTCPVTATVSDTGEWLSIVAR